MVIGFVLGAWRAAFWTSWPCAGGRDSHSHLESRFKLSILLPWIAYLVSSHRGNRGHGQLGASRTSGVPHGQRSTGLRIRRG
jgi:hypothetical protein